MAKYIQNENYKKKSVKQRKSNSNYNDNNRMPDVESCGKEQDELRNESTQGNSETVNRATNKRGQNTDARNKGYMKTKVKNNFTIRSYRKRQDHTPVYGNNPRRKRNENSENSSRENYNKFDAEGGKLAQWNMPSSDHYLEAGTYEGQDIVKSQSLGDAISEDEDAYSMMSDYSDFCLREQYNAECYNYYLNFGDPYVMNNGEISASNNWYYDRQPDYSRVFYYGNQINDSYEGAVRYNFPNHQEFKYRSMDQPQSYQFCVPGEIYLNNYMANNYINGYMEPAIMPNNYYHCPIPPPELAQERYFKPMLYNEPEEICAVSPIAPECDTMNVINLNSSLFVYNSNVHINTVHNEIYGTNTVADGDTEVTDSVVEVTPTIDPELPVLNESENCN